jgi:hypothetical protein
MPIKQELTVGTEVPDKSGIMFKVIANRKAEGFTDEPPIVALCLGFSNIIGTEWAKVQNTGTAGLNITAADAISRIIYGKFSGTNKWLAFFQNKNVVATINQVSSITSQNKTTPWVAQNILDFSVYSSITVQNLDLLESSHLTFVAGTNGKTAIIYNQADQLNFTPFSAMRFTEDDVVIALLSLDKNPTTASNVIAISHLGKIAQTSALDGLAWETVILDEQTENLMTANVIRTAASSQEAIIAAGQNGFMAISFKTNQSQNITLGRNWFPVNNPFNNDGINCVAYANTVWVAVGDNGRIATSRNGTTWTLVQNSSFGTTHIRSVAYGNGIWIAVGNQGKIAYSKNLTEWIPILSSEFPNSVDLTFVTFDEQQVTGIAPKTNVWMIGGTNFTIGISVAGTSAEDNNPFTASAGDIRYYYEDGVAGNITHPHLDIFVEDVPPHDFDPNFKLQVGRTYRTRDNKKVTVNRVDGPYHFSVSYDDLWPMFYKAWYSGRRYADKTDTSDIIEEWKTPQETFTFAHADKYSPFTLSTWGSFLNNSQSLLNNVPPGKTVYHIHFMEALNDTEVFKLVLDGEK